MRRTTYALSLLAILAAQPAEAQAGKFLGVAMSAAGAAMLVMDPQQPAQPAAVSNDTLVDETAALLADTDYFVDRFIAVDPGLARTACAIDFTCAVYAAGGVNGSIVGAAAALSVATRGDRTVYEGTFVPFKERSSTMKYVGAALAAGGALLTALWPDRPRALAEVTVTPTRRGGVRAAKTISW